MDDNQELACEEKTVTLTAPEAIRFVWEVRAARAKLKDKKLVIENIVRESETAKLDQWATPEEARALARTEVREIQSVASLED